MHTTQITTGPLAALAQELTGGDPIVYARGNPDLLTRPLITITGARASSGYGAHITREITEAAIHHGATIVTGGNYGIDAAAIRAALAADTAPIIWTASSTDTHYPAAHVELLTRVLAAGGLILSLNPDGERPTRARFTARAHALGRIADTLIIPECGHRSGTLTTARAALAAGRTVAVAPASILTTTGAGSNALLRDRRVIPLLAPDDVQNLLQQ